MKLSDYMTANRVNHPDLAARVHVHSSTLYRWLKWCADPEAKGASRPDPDQIVSIQRETGGMVSVLDWTQVGPGPAIATPESPASR